MTVTIRQARVSDAARIFEAAREIAHEPGLFVSQPLELSEQKIKYTIETIQGIYLVAEKKGLILGHAFLERLHLQSIRHVAQLTIAVHKGYQDQGIGTLILEKLIEWAKQSSDVEKIELNVRASNARAIALYKKMGFLEEGRLKKRIKVADQYIDDILMALHLKE